MEISQIIEKFEAKSLPCANKLTPSSINELKEYLYSLYQKAFDEGFTEGFKEGKSKVLFG